MKSPVITAMNVGDREQNSASGKEYAKLTDESMHRRLMSLAVVHHK